MKEINYLVAGILIGIAIVTAIVFLFYPPSGSAPGSTTTLTASGTTVTVANTTEISQLKQEITYLQNQINQLNQQVSTLKPVYVYGVVNLTGTFGNGLSTISFASQGITYSVTIKDGQYQIYLPRGQMYQVTIQGSGWFGIPWSESPSKSTGLSSFQLDLTSYSGQNDQISYGVSR